MIGKLFVGMTFALAFAAADDTLSAQISGRSTSDWVFNPIATNSLTSSAGGTSTPRMLAQWPALKSMGVAQTSFVMNGCALRPPHVHQYSSGLLYAIQARNLSVGFVTEAGQLVLNYVQSGASAIFPQGLLHYQQNNDCEPAYYTISYGAEEPGTQVSVPAYEKLPAAVAAANLGLDIASYQNHVATTPKPAFIPNSDPDCVARCQQQGVNVMAPAPALARPITSAGR